jgi:copper(I)-binding protein
MTTTRPSTRWALRGAAVALAAGLLLIGCGSDNDEGKGTTTTAAPGTATTATTATPGAPTVTDAWARKSPSGTSMGALYFTITSPVADRIIGVSVSTEVAAKAELHETVISDDGGMTTTTAMGGTETTMGGEATTTMGGGTETTTTMGGGSMTMHPVDAIVLPANTPVELKPGGYHVMLIDLVKPLEVGQKVTVNLLLEKAGTITVTAPVKEA